MKGRIDFEGATSLPFVDPNDSNLVDSVSNPKVRVFGRGNQVKIIAVDCGIKNNIIRKLVRGGAEVNVCTMLFETYLLH